MRWLFLCCAVVSLMGAQHKLADFRSVAAEAASARNAHDPAKALTLYREAVRLNPSWDEGWWFLGSLEYEADQYDEAVDALQHLVDLKPKFGGGWALLGLCEYQTGRYAAALKHVETGLALENSYQPQMAATLRFHEALLLTRAGDFDAALPKIAAVMQSGKPDDTVLLGLGLVTLHRQQTPREIAAVEREEILDAGRAMVAMLAGDRTDAQSRFQALVRRFPEKADAHYALGYFLLGTNPEQAIAEWDQALAIDKQNGAAHAMLAWVYSLRNDWNKAQERAALAVQNEPHSTAAQLVLARSWIRRGEAVKGIKPLEEVVRRSPNNLEAHMALATAYSEAGRKSEAQRERKICLSADASGNERP